MPCLRQTALFSGCVQRLNRSFTPAMIILTITFIIVFVDRGLLSASFAEVKPYIRESLHTNHTDTFFGLLQSSTVGGYATASMGLGYMTHYYSRTGLLACSIWIWFLSSLAGAFAPSYWVLLVARTLSGAGQGAFACIVPPIIQDNAPQAKKSLWTSIFYASIPVGLALGFGYGSSVSAALSWRWALGIQAIALLPIGCLYGLLDLDKKHDSTPATSIPTVLSGDETACLASSERTSLKSADVIGASSVKPEDTEPPTHNKLWPGLVAVLTNAIFMLTVLGNTVANFVQAGFAAFGPVFIVGLNIVSSDSMASLSFGAVLCVTGILGSVMGGKLADWQRRSFRKNLSELQLDETADIDSLRRADDLMASTKLIAFTVSLAIGLLSALPFITDQPAVWYLLLSAGCTFMFVSIGPVNEAIMLSVPDHARSFALGVSQVIQHAFGDIPSPSIVGAVSDSLSPQSPDGSRDPEGMRVVLFALVTWGAWVGIFWGIAWGLARLQQRRGRRAVLTGEVTELVHKTPF